MTKLITYFVRFIRYMLLLNDWNEEIPFPSFLWSIRKVWRSYFWNKNWYKKAILFKLRKRLGYKNVLTKGGWININQLGKNGIKNSYEQ